MTDLLIAKPPKRKPFGSASAPEKQSLFALKSLLYWFLYATVAGFAFIYFYYTSAQEMTLSLSGVTAKEEIEKIIDRAFYVNMLSFGIFLGGLSIIHLMTTFYLSHKFFGPMVAIRRFVSKITEGEYEEKIHIRETDEFQEFARELNLMADQLRKRHGPDRRSRDAS